MEAGKKGKFSSDGYGCSSANSNCLYILDLIGKQKNIVKMHIAVELGVLIMCYLLPSILCVANEVK